MLEKVKKVLRTLWRIFNYLATIYAAICGASVALFWWVGIFDKGYNVEQVINMFYNNMWLCTLIILIAEICHFSVNGTFEKAFYTCRNKVSKLKHSKLADTKITKDKHKK